MQGGVSVYCFRLVRRVLLSLQSPRLSQQTLRVDWRTCGQAWPPSLFWSHGTDSRPDIFPENMFFQLTFSGFNFWLNPLLWISTCFFLFSTLAGSVSWNRSDSARNARSLWYSLKSSLASYFFFVFMLVRPRLTDLWFFFCVLSYIFFLYMNQTRLSRTFVCVNASPRRHTEIRNKEHVSIWTLWCVFSFFLYHTWRLGSGHDDVDLSVGPDWNISTNTGQIAMKFFHRHSRCSENNPRWLFLKCHHEVSICGFEWSILTSIGWIAITFGIDIHVSARAAPNDYFHRQ